MHTYRLREPIAHQMVFMLEKCAVDRGDAQSHRADPATNVRKVFADPGYWSIILISHASRIGGKPHLAVLWLIHFTRFAGPIAGQFRALSSFGEEASDAEGR